MSLREELLQLISRYTGGGVMRRAEGGDTTISTSDILGEMSPGAVAGEEMSDARRNLAKSRNWQRVRQNEALASREITPYQAQAVADYFALQPEIRAEKAQELGIEDGARLASSLIPDPRIISPRDGVEPVGPDVRAQVRNRALAGRPLPDDEERLSSYVENELPARRERAANSIDELQSAGNVATQAAPFLLPGLGSVASKATAPIVSAAQKSPKLAAGIGGLGILGATTADAGGEADPRLKEIAEKKAAIAELTKKIEALSSKWYPSTDARNNAVAPSKQQLEAAQARIDKLNDQIRDDQINKSKREQGDYDSLVRKAGEAREDILTKSPKPFNEEFPATSKWMPWVPILGGAVVGSLYGGARAFSQQRALGKWDKAIETAQNGRLGDKTRDIATTTAEKFSKDVFPPKADTMMGKVSDFTTPYIGPAIAGAMEGAVIPNLAHGYNMIALTSENPKRKALQEEYRLLPDGPERQRLKAILDDENALPRTNPAYEASRAGFLNPSSTLAGAGEGIAGTLLPTTAGKAFAPQGVTLATRRAQTEAVAKHRPADRPAATPEPPSPPSPPALPAPPAPIQGGALEVQGATPLPQLPLPPKLPPRAAKSKAMEGVEMPAWSGKPPEGVAVPKGHAWDTNINQPRGVKGTPHGGRFGAKPKEAPKAEKGDDVAGFVGGQPVPKKPDRMPSEDDPGMRARGGGVRDLIARYANGGAVISHGLVEGDTPGRADAKPVEVPNGAYVLPADVVSAMGEGNTMAGSKKFRDASPKPYPGFKDGGTVPILISDGEEVVHPSVVMAYGRGDIDQGHRVLDALVKRVRADHIKKLQALPPPANSQDVA